MMMCEPCKSAAAEAVIDQSIGNAYQRDGHHNLCRSLITTVDCEEGEYREREVPDKTQCTCQHRPVKPGQIQKVAK
jgi:hypothetical protein